MKTQKIIVVLILVLFANKASACLDAYQKRVFPLGKCDQGLVVLELDMQRHEARDTPMEKMVIAWSGKSYLRIYTKNNKQIHSEIIDAKLELLGSTYVKDLYTTFSEAENRAKKFNSFQSAEVINISFYHYEKSDEYKLEVDTNSVQLFLSSTEFDKTELHIFSENNPFSQKYLQRMTRYGTDEDIDRETKNNIHRWISISSFRTFKIGEETISVIHLGSGQRLESADGTYRPNTTKILCEGQLFNEPILHHGQGFDYINWN